MQIIEYEGAKITGKSQRLIGHESWGKKINLTTRTLKRV